MTWSVATAPGQRIHQRPVRHHLLVPADYHRVHAFHWHPARNTLCARRPVLRERGYHNGVPNLFARNERLVCIFDTDNGPMAVILVGRIRAGIETVFSGQVTRSPNRW